VLGDGLHGSGDTHQNSEEHAEHEKHHDKQVVVAHNTPFKAHDKGLTHASPEIDSSVVAKC
jgi:hypothetical protein